MARCSPRDGCWACSSTRCSPTICIAGSPRHANDAADRIREVLVERGYTLTFDAPTNQIFITLDNATSERLQRNVRLGFMEKADDTHTVMRICTSWATTDEQVEQLIALL